MFSVLSLSAGKFIPLQVWKSTEWRPEGLRPSRNFQKVPTALYYHGKSSLWVITSKPRTLISITCRFGHFWRVTNESRSVSDRQVWGTSRWWVQGVLYLSAKAQRWDDNGWWSGISTQVISRHSKDGPYSNLPQAHGVTQTWMMVKNNDRNHGQTVLMTICWSVIRRQAGRQAQLPPSNCQWKPFKWVESWRLPKRTTNRTNGTSIRNETGELLTIESSKCQKSGRSVYANWKIRLHSANFAPCTASNLRTASLYDHYWVRYRPSKLSRERLALERPFRFCWSRIKHPNGSINFYFWPTFATFFRFSLVIFTNQSEHQH